MTLVKQPPSASETAMAAMIDIPLIESPPLMQIALSLQFPGAGRNIDTMSPSFRRIRSTARASARFCAAEKPLERSDKGETRVLLNTDFMRIIAILSAISLAGCALLPGGGEDYENTDNGQTTVRLVNPNGTATEWAVSDRPISNRVFVSLPAGRAVGLSIAGSMVLSPSVFLPQPEDYQKAAIQFLNQTDRPSCNVTAGAKTSQFQYEFKYDCTAASNSLAGPPRGVR
jgi:hypothetical protein